MNRSEIMCMKIVCKSFRRIWNLERKIKDASSLRGKKKNPQPKMSKE